MPAPSAATAGSARISTMSPFPYTARPGLPLELVPCFQDFCRTFTNHDTGGHGVAGRHARHDGTIRNAKIFDSVDFEIAINHGQGVSAHLGGTGFVLEARRSIPDEGFEFGVFESVAEQMSG
jgi:hypothetical protein